MIDAYCAALPAGVAPRILASRSVFAADDRAEALHFAGIGLQRFHRRLVSLGRARASGAPSTEQLIHTLDVHLGTPEQVAESLLRDPVIARATDLAVQVHSVDPPHPFVLRSIELVAREIAPALGWQREAVPPARRVA
jgi:alkanesulfonate monooxygenase SsuD/methylene tetrahydromethanopterin reductase-like flavin-dependent oxidoreductase (luciferase family)